MEVSRVHPYREPGNSTTLAASTARIVVWVHKLTECPPPAPANTTGSWWLSGRSARTLNTLLQAQVSRSPDVVALVSQDSHITYRELDCRANQLAHHLQRLGVGPETLVGIYLERSPEMIIALWAVLKSGGAYLPLDSTHPRERQSLILKDSGFPVLLTQQQLVSTLPEYLGHIVCLDRDWEEINRESKESPVSAALGDNLAYAIYTSGSTGRPKGVLVSHAAIASHCVSMLQYYQLTSDDRVLQFASLSFDVSLEQILPTLIAGASLILRSAEMWPLWTFHEQAAQYGLTIVDLPSAYWHQLTQHWVERPDHTPTHLRMVIVGGEAVPPAGVRLWAQTPMKAVRLVNAYGPTETTITATVFEISSWLDSAPSAERVPIGRPLPNRLARVVDGHADPVPPGLPGELCIGGDGLARGYLCRPDLTADRFIPDPFSDEPGARLYRTGDWACLLADGNIELIGRTDDQVKLRGFRIELGEIESALRQHPAVCDAAVVAQEADHRPGDHRLVAYFVQRDGPALEMRSLRAFLKDKLPGYMLPSTFVRLDALPLSPSGKLDRRALPAPDKVKSIDETRVPPRTPVEEMLVEIWSQVLGVESISIHDNFFDLGGHSLLATLIMSRLRQFTGLDLGIQALFEAPTVAALAERIQAALLARAGRPLPPIQRIARTKPLPLSFAQQQLWLVDQLDPGNVAYNLSFHLWLSGPLDVQALRWSLDEITRRHQVLRTTFATIDGQPVQVIAPTLAMELPLVDLSALPKVDRAPQALRLAREHAIQRFDLTTGPLFRASLVRLDESEHILLLTLHHIVFDGWSAGVLLDELDALYRAYLMHTPPPLPDLTIQYADWAAWQREWLQGDELEKRLAFWRRQLFDAPPLLELPTDRPRPPVQTFAGARRSVILPQSLSAALGAASRRESVTLFMLLLAAFKVLLYRYSGQTDLVVGSPHANRLRPEVEGMIGYWVNMLVLRTDLSGNPTFRKLLSRVRQVTLRAYAQPDLPFEMLVRALRPERDPGYNPLFQVAFALQNAGLRIPTLPGLNIALLPVDRGTAQFDLTLEMEETSRGLTASIEYNTDLFDQATITRMLGHLQTLLQAICADPTQHISDLTLLTEPERHQLLVEHNHTRVAYPHAQTLHRRFEHQATETPDAIAVIFEDEQLTCRELDRRANQLARYLLALGVKPETLIGICLERSVEMIVGILGILKAGAAYVPLDPAYPIDRLAMMAQDAGVHVCLTQERLRPMLSNLQLSMASPSFQINHLICLDADWPSVAQENGEILPDQVTGENLAYVLFTSGSTGRPKGVACCHAGVINLLADFQRRQPLSAGDRCCIWTSLSFDVSVYEIFSALLAGGALQIIPDHVRSESARCIPWLHAHHVRSAYLPLFMLGDLRAWLEQHGQQSSLGRLLVGVEPIPAELLVAIRNLAPGLEVINGYGPTEATICATLYTVPSEPVRDRNAPIGRPVQNESIYVLDQHFQPVPVRVPGKLYIAGAGLARGYVNRPELTAERFIPDPFSGEPGARLYDTGDLAIRLPDGNLEFRGRTDHQVKLRGFRIELREIETLLAGHPLVRGTLVLLREDRPGDKRLVGYVAADRAKLSAADLRAFLKRKLPEYMIPAAFVILDALPQTPNGKVDRRALPAPDMDRLESEPSGGTPTTLTEQVVASLWAQVLGLEQVGLHHTLFDLGGHSLSATQILSRVRDVFQVEIPLRGLMDAPTVAGLARLIEQAKNRVALQAPPIQRTSRPERLPLSFAQHRLWFLNQLEPNSSAYHIPVAIRLQGKLDVSALERGLNEIIRRHESLRTTFIALDGQPFQVIAPSLRLELPIIDLSALPAAERQAQARCLATGQALRPFDLAHGPLLRAALVHLDEAEHTLLLSMHHIVSDGWSFSVLIREMASLYRTFSAGQSSPLPELPIQYGDYTLWQREWLQGPVLEAQLAYWKQQLAGSPPALEFSADNVQSEIAGPVGESQSRVLSESLAQALKALSRQEGVTLFMVLLAAFKTWLCRHTGQTDLVLGTAIANRTRAETEALIGLLLNTLPLRTKLDDNPSFRTLLRRVREVTLDAHAHQDLPFEKLVEEIAPERDLNRHPLFDIMLNMINTPGMTLDIPGVQAAIEEPAEAAPKFALTLYVEDQGSGLRLQAVYRRTRFSAERVALLLDQLEHLLEQIVLAPEKTIHSFSLVTARSRPLLPDPSDALAEPHYEPITATLLGWANRSPDQVAIWENECAWTYGQLAEVAQALAKVLLTQGLERGETVAVFGPRSPGLVAGMLAVFMSGGVLLTLDPALPVKRRRLMLEQARAKFLLHIGPGRPEDTGMHGPVQALQVDAETGRCINSAQEQAGPTIALPDLTGDDAAYVFFTSGTTGVPKGVLGCHKGLAHFLHWQRETFAIGPQDRCAQLTALSFDVLLRDILTPLASGATLCLPPQAEDPSSTHILPWLEREGITAAHTVPAIAHVWLAHVPPGASLRCLRWLFLAGEPLMDALVRRWREAFPHSGDLVNLYGPTETTLAKCFYIVPAHVAPGVQPVGRPLPETQALVMNEEGIQCGIGEPGEIILRTPFRSLGYINAPDEQRRRFVVNPFRQDGRDLLYHTGDRGRLRADGVLEILGRTDDQVKVRGVRVEPAEVTAALARHPAVKSCTVIARQDKQGQNALAAYVVTLGQGPIARAELRAYLSSELAAVMVPSVFVFLDQLPLGPNGKVDRSALPAPDDAGPAGEGAFVPPRTPTEELLAGIWMQVLDAERVGVHDNFFDLGGHSLLATQVVSRIREIFQVEFPLSRLFEAVTIAQLAEAIETAQSKPQAAIRPVPRASFRARIPSGQDIGPQALQKSASGVPDGG